MKEKSYKNCICSSCMDTIIYQYKYFYQDHDGNIYGFFCSEDCIKTHEFYTEDCIIFIERC